MKSQNDLDLSHIFADRLAFNEVRPKGDMVFTNGCFDILHRGHIEYLNASRSLGDFLVVGLNSDSSVTKLKGSTRPINNWMDRAVVLSQLRSVDFIIKFDEETPLELIQHLRPVVITKGGDYQMEEMIGKSFVESYGGRVEIISLVEGYSTTDVLKYAKQ